MCCQHSPGYALPEDFGAPDRNALRTALLGALISGRWAIDWDEAAIIVRPAAVTGGKVGACTFWSRAGCEIFETRPSGCRALQPFFNGVDEPECTVDDATIEVFARAWAPHFDILREIDP